MDIQARVSKHGRTLAVGIPIGALVTGLIYICITCYTNSIRLANLSNVESSLNSHLIENAAAKSEILTSLRNIDRRLERIENKIDGNKIALIKDNYAEYTQ